ncbi:hypothetical protein [Dyadobacter luticola]|uniref:WD40 repeat domain-containing protein n=1 Tax=Dyadobacter luticola TaxID=1979387 RepID=A0A5R9L671_9BACT|nr:hypothetical protein [Dyadobacter luticola]TLV03889.1 hypothetical protein FEN17_09955 [Dyadobacter luticola]
MKLELLKVADSPKIDQNQAIWVSDQEKGFYMTDTWKVVWLEAGGNFDRKTIWETNDHVEAYQMKGMYDKRLPDPLFEEIRTQGISGFKLLSKQLYDELDVPAGSTSALEMANRFGLVRGHLPVLGHHDKIFTFEGKAMSMAEMAVESLDILATIRMKGKVPVDVQLHPKMSLIVYITNYSEVHVQHFNQKGFKKCFKVTDLQKPGYQAGFTSDGRYLIICGTGYLQMFEVGETAFNLVSAIDIATRSFAIMDDWLVLNKGMHGLELYHIGERLEKVSSLQIPFAIDRMICHPGQRMLLLTGNPFREIAFIGLSNCPLVK